MNRGVASRLFVGLSLVGLALTAASAQTDPQSAPSQGPPEQARDASRDDLILEQLAMLQNELRALRTEVAELRKAVDDIHRVAVRPNAPPPPSSVSLDDDAVLGSAEAKVAIVEFSDFQCPYCLRFHQNTFSQIKEAYIDTGKVRYVFRDFPLKQIHTDAVDAAVAANCSGRQDRYWEMHDGLFVNQRRLGAELYNELAAEFQLDLEAFQACLKDPEQTKEIEDDLAYGQRVGVRGTPHYFVGRIEENQIVDVKVLSGAQPYEAFARLIDSLIQ